MSLPAPSSKPTASAPREAANEDRPPYLVGSDALQRNPDNQRLCPRLALAVVANLAIHGDQGRLVQTSGSARLQFHAYIQRQRLQLSRMLQQSHNGALGDSDPAKHEGETSP